MMALGFDKLFLLLFETSFCFLKLATFHTNFVILFYPQCRINSPFDDRPKYMEADLFLFVRFFVRFFSIHKHEVKELLNKVLSL